MTLLQLQVFLCVVETGSFTKAAERLSMTQSGISHMISGLEEELGVVLLSRSRKGSKMTEAGEKLWAHARAIMQHVEQIQDEMFAFRGLERGTLRIGTFPSVSARFLPSLMALFQVRYPGIELILFEGTNQEVRNWIHTGAVNVGFVSLPDQEFDTTPVMKDEMLLLLPADHQLAGQSSVAVSQIAHDPFILTRAGCEGLVLSMFRPAVPQVKYEVQDTATILAMVKQGLGITILPQMALPDDTKGISAVRLDPPVYRHLGLAVQSSAAASPAVRTFIREAETFGCSLMVETVAE
ncbi:LysR family transcriptional regulator [Brevibacillus fluminis]|uniref:LysR family transcriptional regulator n=1 Tax=Brevibacillus fluminis TaxID=511487 RepID=UPI003F8925DA